MCDDNFLNLITPYITRGENLLTAANNIHEETIVDENIAVLFTDIQNFQYDVLEHVLETPCYERYVNGDEIPENIETALIFIVGFYNEFAVQLPRLRDIGDIRDELGTRAAAAAGGAGAPRGDRRKTRSRRSKSRRSKKQKQTQTQKQKRRTQRHRTTKKR